MLKMSVHRVVVVFAFMAMLSTVAMATELEETDQRVNDVQSAYSGSKAVMDLVSRLSDFAARSTTYSSLLTLNVANVIILALIAFVALGYFGFLDFGAARSMARSASDSLLDSEFMDSLMQGVEVALEKFQHLD